MDLFYRCIILFVIIEALSLTALRAGEKSLPYSGCPPYETRPDSLDSIKRIDKYIAVDKAKHFTASMIGTIFLYKMIENSLKQNEKEGKVYSVSLTLTLGITKEFYDKSRPENYFSWKDVLADIAGIAMGLVLINQP